MRGEKCKITTPKKCLALVKERANKELKKNEGARDRIYATTKDSCELNMERTIMTLSLCINKYRSTNFVFQYEYQINVNIKTT